MAYTLSTAGARLARAVACERFLAGQAHVLDTLVDTGHASVQLAVQLDVQPHVVDRIGIA